MRDLEKQLRELGCPFVRAPIQPGADESRLPFLAFLEGSDLPTEEEFKVLSRLIVHLSARHGSKPGSSGDRDAPTVTLRKVGGSWAYVQPSNAAKSWQVLTNLEQLFSKL